MRTQQIDLLGGYYADDSRAWSAQDCVNFVPEIAEVNGTRTRMKLASLPGLKDFSLLAIDPELNPGNTAIRGLHNAEGRLFVVAGVGLYQVSTNGESTYLGKIPGVGRVYMEHNQITGGNELLVVNGQSGGGYVWNTKTKTFKKVADDAYTGARSIAYMDSYLLQVEPFGRYWFHSDLADATAYNSLDRYESEASPDKIVHLAVSQSEVVVFNETTTEFFYNAGTTTGTFQNKNVLIERGCASGASVVKLDNSLFWLGDDGVVYRLDGYQAVPVSTGPVQKAFRDKNWSQAFAFSWESARHKVYYLTFPDGHTWGYDVVTQLWHRRASFGLDRWRLTHLVRWNNQWIGGDFQQARLWTVDDTYMLEGDQPLVRERVSQTLSAHQNTLVVNYLELLVRDGDLPTFLNETNASEASAEEERAIEVCYSDDGGYTFTNWRRRELGAVGQRGKRIRLNRLGSTRARVWKIRTSSPIPTELHGAVAVVEVGT